MSDSVLFWQDQHTINHMQNIELFRQEHSKSRTQLVNT